MKQLQILELISRIKKGFKNREFAHESLMFLSMVNYCSHALKVTKNENLIIALKVVEKEALKKISCGNFQTGI